MATVRRSWITGPEHISNMYGHEDKNSDSKLSGQEDKPESEQGKSPEDTAEFSSGQTGRRGEKPPPWPLAKLRFSNNKVAIAVMRLNSPCPGQLSTYLFSRGEDRPTQGNREGAKRLALNYVRKARRGGADILA